MPKAKHRVRHRAGHTTGAGDGTRHETGDEARHMNVDGARDTTRKGNFVISSNQTGQALKYTQKENLLTWTNQLTFLTHKEFSPAC